MVQAGGVRRHFEHALSALEAAAGCALDWRRVAFWRRAVTSWTAWCKAKETKLCVPQAASRRCNDATDVARALAGPPFKCMQLTCNMHMPACTRMCMVSELAEVELAGCLPGWRQHRTLNQGTLNQGCLWV